MTVQKRRGPVPTAGILQQKIFGLPVDRQIIFSNHKKAYKKRVEKRQRKLIIKISFLKSFLNADEKILLVTTGHSPPTLFEKLGIGWLFVYLKRSLLVFTDRRMFHIPTTPVYKYRNSIAQISYREAKSIEMKGRTLVVAYPKAETVDRFFSISGRETKKINEILKNMILSGDGSSSGGRTHLCPQCAAPLVETAQPCRRCELKFKSTAVARLLAILLPGGGYFYVRQYFLGILAAVLEIILFIVIAGAFNDLASGYPPSLLWLAGASVLLVVEKSAAAVHAGVLTHEFVPRRREVSFRTLAQQVA